MKSAGKYFLIFVILLTGFIRIISLMGPVARNSQEVVDLVIEAGSNSNDIANSLFENNLISSVDLFKIIINLRRVDNRLKAGFYELKPSYNLWEIITILVEGKVATFSITIPEGFTFEEIVERLAQLTPYTSKDFLLAKQEFNKPFLADLKDKQKYLLEGFLYSDTYLIPQGSTVYEILNIMLTEFEKKWWHKLVEKEKKGELLVSPYELVIIASLIEKEAKLEKEKELIAAVIYNRLQRGMLLQLDASIQYSLPERKERLLYRDLTIDSPYNTYIYSGLPPGPIASPGSASIKAALNPANVDYLFYFALTDGSHVFSRTYREHLQLQEELRDNNR